MARISFGGAREYMAKLARLSALEKEQVLGPAVFAGAKVVADEVRNEIDAIPADPHWGRENRKTSGPFQSQKESLKNSLGIAPMQTDAKGYINVKIGFDGYNEHRTSTKWPKGEPNQMVARAIESGTSFMEGHPFIKTAVQNSRKAAVETMAKKVDEEIDKIMKG